MDKFMYGQYGKEWTRFCFQLHMVLLVNKIGTQIGKPKDNGKTD